MQNTTHKAQQAIIKVTDNAVNRIKHLMEKRSKATAGIKVGVKSGGCSGLAYTFEYADEQPAAAEVVYQQGVNIFIDQKAVLYLIGTTLDYIDEKLKSGFIFINPNERGKCGCGESFNV